MVQGHALVWWTVFTVAICRRTGETCSERFVIHILDLPLPDCVLLSTFSEHDTDTDVSAKATQIIYGTEAQKIVAGIMLQNKVNTGKIWAILR